MPKRKGRRRRKHIPLAERLASALADTLAQEERDALRAAKVPAQVVLRMFTPDHVVLHCHGGADKWWNLTMRRRGAELRAKDARDTSIAAKSVRIGPAWRKFTRDVLGPKKRRPRRREPRSRWASRPLRSKGENRWRR